MEHKSRSENLALYIAYRVEVPEITFWQHPRVVPMGAENAGCATRFCAVVSSRGFPHTFFFNFRVFIKE